MRGRRIRHGAYAGLLGGIVFGVQMGFMGTLPLIGKMVGHPTAGVGFLVHLLDSAVIAAAFGFVLGGLVMNPSRGLKIGLVYGGVWWVLGPLTLMPLMLGEGLGAHWNLAAAGALFPGLIGHLIYGAITGTEFARLQSHTSPVGARPGVTLVGGP